MSKYLIGLEDISPEFGRPIPGRIEVWGGWGDYRTKTRSHTGLDIKAGVGTPVYAMADGIVYQSGYSPYPTGNWIGIHHASGWGSHYVHLDTMKVKKGQHVSKGQLIGTVGKSEAKIPHLHLGVALNKNLLPQYQSAYGKPAKWGRSRYGGLIAVPAEPVVPVDYYKPRVVNAARQRNVMLYDAARADGLNIGILLIPAVVFLLISIL